MGSRSSYRISIELSGNRSRNAIEMFNKMHEDLENTNIIWWEEPYYFSKFSQKHKNKIISGFDIPETKLWGEEIFEETFCNDVANSHIDLLQEMSSKNLTVNFYFQSC